MHPHSAVRALLALLSLVIVASLAFAQEQPPWKRPGHPFYNNPAGYARDIHASYMRASAKLAWAQGALPTYNLEPPTPADRTPAGFAARVRDALDVVRLRRAAEQTIAAMTALRGNLEAEWAQWCEMGLLGSPMPPLSAANEMIEETYLDRSTYPNVIRKQLTDRIDFNLRYFLEEKLAATPPPAAGAGGGAGGTFTEQPFMGLQITYSVSGGSLGAFEDGGPFEGWIRTYKGTLGTGTLRVTGTVKKENASDEWPGDASIVVRAGDKSADKAIHLTKGSAPVPFDVSVPIPPGAKSGEVNVTIGASFRNGEQRFVQVVAHLAAGSGGAAPAATGGGGGGSPPPPASAPVDPAEGRIYPVGEAPTVVPLDGGEGVTVTAGAPLDWDLEGWLTTGAEAPTILVFPEAYRATLSGGSQLGLGDPDGVILRTGSAYHDVESRRSDFTVTTRCGVACTRGARFATEVLDNDAMLVAVLSGSVEITGLDLDQTTSVVRAGQAAMVVLGEAPSEAADLTDDQIDALFASDFRLLMGEAPLPEGDGGGTGQTGGSEALADVGSLRIGTGMEEGKLVGVAETLTAPKRIAVQYDYHDLAEGSVCEVVWARDGEELLRDTRPLKTSGIVTFTIAVQGGAEPMPAGRYTVTLSVGGSVVGRKTFTVRE